MRAIQCNQVPINAQTHAAKSVQAKPASPHRGTEHLAFGWRNGDVLRCTERTTLRAEFALRIAYAARRPFQSLEKVHEEARDHLRLLRLWQVAALQDRMGDEVALAISPQTAGMSTILPTA